MSSKAVSILFSALALFFTMATGSMAAQELTPLYTLPAGGTVYVLGAGIVSVSNKYMPATKFVQQASTGTLDIIRKMMQKDVQKKDAFGIFATVDGYNAYKGNNEYARKPFSNLRAVTFINNTDLYLVVRANSPIQSYKDCKGKRLGIGAAGSTMANTAIFLLEQHGVPKNGFKAQYYSYREIVEGIQDNSLDGGFLAGGFPIAAYTELATNFDVRIVPVDEPVLKKLSAYPYYYRNVVKAKSYKGLNKDVPIMGFSVGLHVNANANPDLVYKTIKNLYEHKSDYYAIHSSAKELTVQNATKGFAIPFHPGAQKYLNEIGALMK
ncbi:MAG: TAXI family TRAP transporter solute-binding subunit [Syntrophorhabdaceae bacterium]